MKIILINLDADTERRHRTEGRLQELGLRWERLPAIDGRRLLPEHEALVDRDAQAALGIRRVSPGAIGCWLSHRRAQQMIIESGDETGLILEDDIRIQDDLPEILNQVERGVIRDFEMLRIHRLKKKEKYVPVRNIGNGRTLGLVGFYDQGTQAYLITREAALRFIEAVPRMVYRTDTAINRYWEHGIVAYSLDPPVVFHEDHGQSSINARPGGHHGLFPLDFWIRKQWRQVRDYYPRWRVYRRILKVSPGS